MDTRLIAATVVSLFSGWAAAQSHTAAPVPAASADRPAAASAAPRGRDDARPGRGAAFEQEKARLMGLLQGANEREEYIKVLQNNGYRVASTHVGGANYLEYEVVKGGRSYEVQLDFDPGARKASRIDVTPNLWRAEATTKMLSDPTYQPAAALTTDTEGRYSDRRYIKDWTAAREQLEQALPARLKVPQDYKKRIEDLHYKIASVDDRADDRLEYRITKGDNHYQVQIGFDPKSRVAQSVEVTDDAASADAGGSRNAAPAAAR